MKHINDNTMRSQAGGNLQRRLSTCQRHAEQERKIALTHNGKNWRWGTTEKASADMVHGKLASKDPSVPERLLIGAHQQNLVLSD